MARLVLRLAGSGDEEIDGASCNSSPAERGFALPTGAPTALDCDQARLVVTQARTMLAAAPLRIDPAKFAEATSDWLDPHGLWSVAPDAPAGAALRREAAALLDELQAPPGSGPCLAALRLGAELFRWSRQVSALFDEGKRAGEARPPATAAEAWTVAMAAPFEDGVVTRSARDLARELGREAGTLHARYGASIDRYVDAARERLSPSISPEGWAQAVIAAALRAYVPQLDAHGAWAPLEEEISIYDLALEVSPPSRLWSEMTRTALGVRIDRGAPAPLRDGDVLLHIEETPLAGMSVEQAEQMSLLGDMKPGAHTRVALLRRGLAAPIELMLAPEPEPPFTVGAAELTMELARYGDGEVAILAIPDVPDDLGDRLSRALLQAREHGSLRGVVLDLRANGGGSTDGAIAAIGHFLPGATLFPMRRRDGGIEVERAPDIPPSRGWAGPVAALVDGDSASAAEMIAGALASYRRGVVVGDRTYGKGCAQEYLDDEAHVGVLRLTTLLYALPDGSPVQKTGISPQLSLTLPASLEREARVEHALGPWRGPDVRDAARVREVPWPTHGGRVGPCPDDVVCRALRAIGAVRAAAR
ncbi:S41 family peptidase [Chondromyces apiculatus]|uniref:Tail specific protease domain-containing protein n=1 Tax=Chondromyces apiculatus DSM 436 TaxID=1192034 RepID=A0A017T1E8_9BACT|nr:S41 family peptidase [Chondromyces apiculatus]EYF03054.1 Hypothetical protein CAP_6317 [Chondromyces apiculatus DSM 436]